MRASLFVLACLMAQQVWADECPSEAECDGNILLVCANGMVNRIDCTSYGATWKCGKLSERFGNGCYDPDNAPPCGDVTAEAKCDGDTLKRCVTDTQMVDGELIETGDHLETEDCDVKCGPISNEIGEGCYPTADFQPCGDVTKAGSCEGNQLVYCDWNPESHNVDGLVKWSCGAGEVCSTESGEAECVDAGDVDGGALDGGAAEDGGAVDGGAAEDGGAVDGGAAEDGGALDAGAAEDGGAVDGGAAEDGGALDAGAAEDSGAVDGGAAEDGGAAQDSGEDAASGQDAGTGDGGSSGGSGEPATQDAGSSDAGDAASGQDAGNVTPGADAGDEESDDDDGDDGCSAQPGRSSGFLGALPLIALFGLRRRKRA